MEASEQELKWAAAIKEAATAHAEIGVSFDVPATKVRAISIQSPLLEGDSPSGPISIWNASCDLEQNEQRGGSGGLH